MEVKINQLNVACQKHGYWEEYYDKEKKKLWYKCHYFNGVIIGYDELWDHQNNVVYNLTRLNDDVIGCEQYKKSQYFYTNSRKKFGEEIRWK